MDNIPEDTIISCQVVRRKNDFILVSWEDGDSLEGAWVIPSMIVSEDKSTATAEVRNPREGLQHGESWAKLLPNPSVTPETIDRELKRRGIWTIADLQARPDVARNCLQRAYGVDLGALLRAASRKQKQDGGN